MLTYNERHQLEAEKTGWNAVPEILIINVTGEDKPGITNAITSVLASAGASILDIGQAVIHSSLSLGMLVEIDDKTDGEKLRDQKAADPVSILRTEDMLDLAMGLGAVRPVLHEIDIGGTHGEGLQFAFISCTRDEHLGGV